MINQSALSTWRITGFHGIASMDLSRTNHTRPAAFPSVTVLLASGCGEAVDVGSVLRAQGWQSGPPACTQLLALPRRPLPPPGSEGQREGHRLGLQPLPVGSALAWLHQRLPAPSCWAGCVPGAAFRFSSRTASTGCARPRVRVPVCAPSRAYSFGSQISGNGDFLRGTWKPPWPGQSLRAGWGLSGLTGAASSARTGAIACSSGEGITRPEQSLSQTLEP
ncbi:uncharacterized protein LOC128830974 [Malaclemys terrapin pileata]|uniref:uncharacterized protein LOC128830974 n=1 Tax=Malaclemys terrapin pileata TaxID=2991368 RepID=UPI0023A87E9A|nr:uncharacterized protein LOC128830974 [Malaclemys terrapin pileata]